MLMERLRALDEMGLYGVVWDADLLEQMQCSPSVARALHAEATGLALSRYGVRSGPISTLCGCIWMHLARLTSVASVSFSSPRCGRSTAASAALVPLFAADLGGETTGRTSPTAAIGWLPV